MSLPADVYLYVLIGFGILLLVEVGLGFMAWKGIEKLTQDSLNKFRAQVAGEQVWQAAEEAKRAKQQFVARSVPAASWPGKYCAMRIGCVAAPATGGRPGCPPRPGRGPLA